MFHVKSNADTAFINSAVFTVLSRQYRQWCDVVTDAVFADCGPDRQCIGGACIGPDIAQRGALLTEVNNRPSLRQQFTAENNNLQSSNGGA